MRSPLIVSIIQIMCNNCNPVRRQKPDSEQYYVVPESYQFHTPCPWGKSEIDQTCLACVNHRRSQIWAESITEEQGDAIQEGLDGAQ